MAIKTLWLVEHECGGDEFADRFEVPARTVTSASWWIDQRDTDPADLEELLSDVSVDSTSTDQNGP